MTARVVLARRTRAPLLASFLAAIVLLVPSTTAEASEPDAGQRILQVAMQYEGQHGGQCFPFVRRIVQEALGRAMGFGYHDGYIEGGAVEVTLETARPGDVIQIADPNDNGPGASHPGLHTVIVIEPHADGTFKVIDSNFGWDEIVQVHDGYDPVASANRYANLGVRVYRFSLDGTEGPPANQGPLQSAEVSFSAGDTARVSTTGSCLNLRGAPSTSGNIIRCLANGTTVTILGDTVESGGFRWQRVQAGSDAGWVADEFLVPAGSLPPPSSPSSPSPPESTSRIISGTVPSSGGLALLLWDGGPLSAFVSEASGEGCGLLSVWSTAGGRMLGHIVGAPEFVNGEWLQRYPGDLPRTPLLALCARPGGNQAVGTTPAPPPSQPSAPPSDGDFITTLPPGTVPGPAGNE